MDRAVEILLEAVESLEKEHNKVLFDYRYGWMTTEQKMSLTTSIVREIKGLTEAINVLEVS